MFSHRDNRTITPFIDELARELNRSTDDADQLFNTFCSSLTAALLARHTAVIRGFGTFTLQHVPATRGTTGSSIIFSPPNKRLCFSTATTGPDETKKLAIDASGMMLVEADHFATILPQLLTRQLQNGTLLIMPGLGRFTPEGESYRFHPDPELDALLNRHYHDLGDVVLPGTTATTKRNIDQAHNASRRRTPLIATLLLLTVTAILVTLVTRYRGTALPGPALGATTATPAPPTSTTPSGSAVTRTGATTVTPVAAINPATRITSPDSLQLTGGHYTLVLATFKTITGATAQIRQFKATGLVTYIWPAMMNGERYYRLATGDYTTYGAADTARHTLSGNQESGAYIQKINQTVVVYAKQSM